jgi:hypothetical protein
MQITIVVVVVVSIIVMQTQQILTPKEPAVS